MSRKTNGVNWSMTPQAKLRRVDAIKRLKAQLESGKKRNKENLIVDLTDKDVKRINKELEILKTRI